MFTHPDTMGRLANQHHRTMIADARQHQLRREARPASRTPNAGSAIARRLIAAIAKVSITATRVPDAS